MRMKEKGGTMGFLGKNASGGFYRGHDVVTVLPANWSDDKEPGSGCHCWWPRPCHPVFVYLGLPSYRDAPTTVRRTDGRSRDKTRGFSQEESSRINSERSTEIGIMVQWKGLQLTMGRRIALRRRVPLRNIFIYDAVGCWIHSSTVPI